MAQAIVPPADFLPALINNESKEVAVECLRTKVVGLYFSAHWCPPCRGFTPLLAQAYEVMKQSGKDFEIVFISSDKNEDSFKEYLSSMPWLALPFEDRQTKAKLSTKYKVSGIPTLVILDTDGSVITTDGRTAVDDDPTGEQFPWRPKPFSEVIGTRFLRKGGPVGREAIENKFLAIYFSAHWCPPCRGFTPRLVQTYNTMKATRPKQDFEFIFVSSDQSQEEFDKYFAEMPWLALPFEDRAAKSTLSSMFGVSGIPTLVTVGPDGQVINKSARGVASEDAQGEHFPWLPKALVDLASGPECNGFDINDKPSLVVLMEHADDMEQKEIEQALLPIANEVADSGRQSGDPEMLCFTGKHDGGIVTQLRQHMSLKGGGSPDLVMINIPDNGGFYVAQVQEITESTIRKFIADWKAGVLERKQLGA